jgi:ribose-phosphate pyrophosphokinase
VSDIVVFSGNAHRRLAEDICSNLGIALSSSDITRFSNDCVQVQLLANCRQRDVYLIQPLVPPTQEHLMELLMMVDAARGASAASITVVIPHYAYARSDKKDASRISFGGRLVADLLVTAGAHRVLTMTLHAPQVHGFFTVPVDHLTAIGEIATHYRGSDLDNVVVVSPDLGNAKTASLLARLLGVPVAAGSKQRLADDKVVVDAIVGDVHGKRAIILDDEIATGGSIPLVNAFQQAVPEAEMLLLGTTDGFANIHAPNERVLVDEFEKAVLAEAEFFGLYAAAKGAV